MYKTQNMSEMLTRQSLEEKRLQGTDFQSYWLIKY